MQENILYTIRNFYENQNRTGIILTLSGKDSKGAFHTIKAYVPYKSRFEDAPTAEKLLKINSQEACARVTIRNEKKFEDGEQ